MGWEGEVSFIWHHFLIYVDLCNPRCMQEIKICRKNVTLMISLNVCKLHSIKDMITVLCSYNFWRKQFLIFCLIIDSNNTVEQTLYYWYHVKSIFQEQTKVRLHGDRQNLIGMMWKNIYCDSTLIYTRTVRYK